MQMFNNQNANSQDNQNIPSRIPETTINTTNLQVQQRLPQQDVDQNILENYYRNYQNSNSNSNSNLTNSNNTNTNTNSSTNTTTTITNTNSNSNSSIPQSSESVEPVESTLTLRPRYQRYREIREQRLNQETTTTGEQEIQGGLQGQRLELQNFEQQVRTIYPQQRRISDNLPVFRPGNSGTPYEQLLTTQQNYRGYMNIVNEAYQQDGLHMDQIRNSLRPNLINYFVNYFNGFVTFIYNHPLITIGGSIITIVSIPFLLRSLRSGLLGNLIRTITGGNQLPDIGNATTTTTTIVVNGNPGVVPPRPTELPQNYIISSFLLGANLGWILRRFRR